MRRLPYPARPDQPLTGGPQMVEVSRDSRRVYFTNSLYGSRDDQFYPDGVGAWMVKLDVAEGGGMTFVILAWARPHRYVCQSVVLFDEGLRKIGCLPFDDPILGYATQISNYIA